MDFTTFEFERQIAVEPVKGQPDTFVNIHPPWFYPHARAATGALISAQASLAASHTVPAGFTIHWMQAEFFKAVAADVRLSYEVQRAFTSSRFACRVVQLRQNSVLTNLITVNFVSEKLVDDETPHLLDHAPDPSPETLQAAAHIIDPALNDFDYGPRPGQGESPRPTHLPDDTPWPASESERLPISPHKDIPDRIHRCKLRTTSPLSSRTAQILAIIFLSDLWTVDAALTIQGFKYGNWDVGDKARRIPQPDVKYYGTLNHTMRFYRTQGWDVQRGVLFETKSRWAIGRRALLGVTARDSEGRLIATGEQEAYFLFVDKGDKSENRLLRKTREIKM